jgi:hypothetical protein
MILRYNYFILDTFHPYTLYVRFGAEAKAWSQTVGLVGYITIILSSSRPQIRIFGALARDD